MGDKERTVRVLVVGDVVGGPGRAAFRNLYPRIREEKAVEFCIVNAENAAGGSGLTFDTAEELLQAGADVLTSGDHIWRREEASELLNGNSKVLRPLNFPPGAPGRGSRVFSLPGGGEIGVISLLGRVFMAPLDCPFRLLEGEVNVLSRRTRLIVVDFHAEATSEKAALARHFDGRVSAVVGTHTHVPTADARILAGKTAFISDIGMCGSLDSILGREPKAVITAFVTGRPVRFPVAAAAPGLQGVLLELDRTTGLALGISAVNYGGEEVR